MILGAVLVSPTVFAQAGVVSVNGGALISGTVHPSTVSVPINVASSEPFNSFDIQVISDPTILSPSSVSIAGSVLGNTPTIALECINGIIVTGAVCSTNDAQGVVHLVLSQTTLTASTPTSGLLFTINYNVIADTTGSTVSFQTGCTSTSIGNSDCVTVSAGPTLVPETDQSATFANLVNFKINPAFTTLSTPSGIAINDQINYVAVGGYTDIVNEACTAPTGDTCSFTLNSVDLTSSTTGSDTLSVVGSASGSVVVTGTGAGFCSCGVKTNSATVAFNVQSADYSISLSQSLVTISRGSSDSSTTIASSGVGGFSGTISFVATSVAGITGSAPMATLTNSGSGLSSASSTLTISVASNVATGSYTLTVTPNGSTSHAKSITVVVPGQDFSLVAVPNSIGIIRGGSVSSDINLASFGNFAGTIAFTATVSPVAGQQDSCCLTNNISPSFSHGSITLSAGGTGTVAFSAQTVSGLAPTGANYTATGNYTATITATGGGVTHTTVIAFFVQDIGIGPSFCTGNTFVQTSPDSNYSSIISNTTATGGDIAGQTIGTPCSSLTITDQPNVLFPYLSVFSSPAQILWVQSNALGGLVTDGFNGLPSVTSLNAQEPFNGVVVPQLATVYGHHSYVPTKACMVPTFWPNGTQIPYSYLAANGPLILPSGGLLPFLSIIHHRFSGSNWGCRNDPPTYPRDQGNNPELNSYENCFGPSSTCGNFGLCPPNFDPSTPCDYQNILNPDFFAVTAMSLVGTVAGDYTFLLCGQAGVIRHCTTYGLNVVPAPVVHQLVVKKSVSFLASGGNIPFRIGISNPSLTHTIFVQVTVTGIGNLGDTFSATSGVISIAPNANANNIAFTAPLTSSEIGETFTFSFSMIVGTDTNNLDGISNGQSIQQTVHITA